MEDGWIERSEFGVSRVIRPVVAMCGAEEKMEASGETKGGCKRRHRMEGGTNANMGG